MFSDLECGMSLLCILFPLLVPATRIQLSPPNQHDEQQITALSYLSVYPDVADIQFSLQPPDTLLSLSSYQLAK